MTNTEIYEKLIKQQSLSNDAFLPIFLGGILFFPSIHFVYSMLSIPLTIFMCITAFLGFCCLVDAFITAAVYCQCVFLLQAGKYITIDLGEATPTSVIREVLYTDRRGNNFIELLSSKQWNMLKEESMELYHVVLNNGKVLYMLS